MKKINYDERAKFYDLEVTKDEKITKFLEKVSKKFKVKKIINCPCASGIYFMDFSNIYQYSYFVDIDNAMIEKLNQKISENNILNVETLKLDIREINKLNGLADCVIMLNQGLQYIKIEDFKNLLNKLEFDCLILDLFDFRKKGNLTYFKFESLENTYYLTKKFKLIERQVIRYNKFKWYDRKIAFKYKYYINDICEYTTEFQLYNYSIEDVSNIINSSKYKIYEMYSDYNFKEYNEQNGHYILVLRRSNNGI